MFYLVPESGTRQKLVPDCMTHVPETGTSFWSVCHGHKGHEFFANFLATLYSGITLQQLQLCCPLYLALSWCDPSFTITPTYKVFHHHYGTISPCK